MRDLPDVIGTKPDETAGLSLWNQREATPECARPVATAQMRSGREMAKPEADRTLSARQRKIVAVLTAYGPLNRFQIHELTLMAENSVNSACNALLKSATIMHHHYDVASKREVLAVTPPPSLARAK